MSYRTYINNTNVTQNGSSTLKARVLQSVKTEIMRENLTISWKLWMSSSRSSNREDFETENIIWRSLNAVTCEKCKELGSKKG